MAPFSRAFVVAVLLAGLAAGAADAATLRLSWDPSPESTVTGYRVYVGTSPGVHTEFVDVGPLQNTLFYTKAIAGRRYYLAVAALAGAATSPKSVEVSAVAGPEAFEPPPALPGPGLEPPKDAPPDFWFTFDNNRSSIDPGGGRGASIARIASGLSDVTVLAALPTGGGLLVEEGTRVRLFSDQGAGGVALYAPEGTRFAAAAADPRFATNGFVYVAEARETRDGAEEVFVVRHRLLAGTLGESAAIVVGQRQPVGTLTRVAVTAAGEVVLVQGEARSLAWDQERGGLWSVGFDETSGAAFSFTSSSDRVGGFLSGFVQPVDGSVFIGAAVAVLDGTPRIALATPTTVFRFDVGASKPSAGTSVAGLGTVISLIPASANVDYVVVRGADTGGSGPSIALLRVQHADPP